jgi:hypothetical protein
MNTLKRFQYVTKNFGTLPRKFNIPLLRHEIPKPLGRWNIDYCPNIIDRKIDFANEDNCGACDQYNKIEDNQNNTLDSNLSIEELEILFNANVIE